MTSTKATAHTVMVASTPSAAPCVAIATTIASSVQAVTSSTAAQVIAVEPSGVVIMLRSTRIRASTGNAVMLIAIPMNSAKAWNGTPAGAYAEYIISASATPSRKGNTMLTWL